MGGGDLASFLEVDGLAFSSLPDEGFESRLAIAVAG